MKKNKCKMLLMMLMAGVTLGTAGYSAAYADELPVVNGEGLVQEATQEEVKGDVEVVEDNTEAAEVNDEAVTDNTEVTDDNKDEGNVEVASEASVEVTLSYNNQYNTNILSPVYTIKNTSDEALDLSTLEIKYYYTCDSDADQSVACYYAGTIDGEYKGMTSYVEEEVSKISTVKGENADSCVTVKFNGGVLDAGQSMKVDANVNKNDWSAYDKSNDYSYNDQEKIGVFVDGKLISGSEPTYKTSDEPEEEEDLGPIYIDVNLEYNNQYNTNILSPVFVVRNTTMRPLDLKDMEIVYYYTADGDADQTFNCYNAQTVDGKYESLTEYVQGTIGKTGAASYEKADDYMSVKFTDGVLEIGQTMKIAANVNKNDWSAYDKSNDYSYDNQYKVSVFVKGERIWGQNLNMQ